MEKQFSETELQRVCVFYSQCILDKDTASSDMKNGSVPLQGKVNSHIKKGFRLMVDFNCFHSGVVTLAGRKQKYLLI